MNRVISIADRVVSDQSPTFVIAELSCNHRHDFELTMRTVDAMIESGADCIKLQTLNPDKITIDSDKSDFVVKGNTLWDNVTFYSLYKDLYTPVEWHLPIKEYVESKGKVFFSSPFDKEAVDFLDDLHVPAFKVASFEITDIPLIGHIACKGKPILISTGIATKEDIELALQTCLDAGNDQVILLKCTSAYPAPVEDANLRMIPRLRADFDCLVGLSDHTQDNAIISSAVALGARVIEKHFILDRSLGGPDAAFSLEPREFAEMVATIRNTEKSLGRDDYYLSEKVQASRAFSRSLYVVKDIREGEVITEEYVRSIRPGYGLHPKYLSEILGKRVNRDLEKGTRFSTDYLNAE